MSSILNISKRIFKLLSYIVIIAVFILVFIQVYFYFGARIQLFHNADKLPETDYVLILGCGIYKNDPSPMLKNRLDAGLKILEKNENSKVILSGYKEGDYYDEVNVMKNYIIENGIDSNRIIEDKTGDNTYYSVENIKKESDEKIVIVTQKWHLIRAIYIANKLDIKNVKGLVAEPCPVSSTTRYMNLREYFARIKAILDVHGIHTE